MGHAALSAPVHVEQEKPAPFERQTFQLFPPAGPIRSSMPSPLKSPETFANMPATGPLQGPQLNPLPVDRQTIQEEPFQYAQSLRPSPLKSPTIRFCGSEPSRTRNASKTHCAH